MDKEVLAYLKGSDKNMEQMNSKLSVKYEYKDVYGNKQQKEISIASETIDDFNIFQIADFVLNAISLTGYSVRGVLLTAVEKSEFVHEIVDDLNDLGYGSKEKE